MSSDEAETEASLAARKAAKRERKAAKAALAAGEGATTVEEPPRKKKRPAEAAAPSTVARQPPPARLPPPAPGRPAEGGPAEVHEVFVKFLPRDVTEAELSALFRPCGALAKPPMLLRDYATGAPKGAGWVTFSSAAAARQALTLNGHPLRGRHLEVSAATCRKERPGLRGQLQAPGTHTPALLAEVLDSLVAPERSGTYIDATFGRGGHTRGILGALTPAGRLHAFDMDPLAVSAGDELAAGDPRFAIHASMFSRMAKVLPKALHGTVSGILFDLGISSPQLDDPGRGMRPEAKGPLDLRFDVASGEPAWRFLETATRQELAEVLARNGDGQDCASAARVADAVALAREVQGGVPRSTEEMAALVAAARCGGDYQPMHAAKLTFQALRMHVNDERGQCRAGLRAALRLLKPGGRIGVITWKHSECLMVMDFLRDHELAGTAFPLRAWWEGGAGRAALPTAYGLRRGEPRRPGAEELRTNARSRSAVLHVLHKEQGVTVAAVEAAVHAQLGWETLVLPGA